MTTPASISAPTVSGLPMVGVRLTVTPGVWTPTPSGYSYVWHRIPAGKTTPLVQVATGSGYTPVPADVGFMLAVTVTATIGGSSDTAASDQIGPVVVGKPVNVTPPAISGIPAVGDRLTVSTGTWSG